MQKPSSLSNALCEFVITQYLVEACHDQEISTSERATIQRLQKGLNLKRDTVNRIYKEILNNIADYSQDREVNLGEFYELLEERFNEELGDDQVRECLDYIKYLIEYKPDKSKDVASKNQKSSKVSPISSDIKKASPNQQLQNMHSDSSFQVGEMADEECSRLLQEVSQKDWEEELDEFRLNRVEMMIEEEVNKSIEREKEQGMKKGAIAGAAILGFVGLFLPWDLVMVAVLVTGIGVSLVSIVLTGGVGVLVAALLGIAGLILYSLVFAPMIAMLGAWFSKLACVGACGLIGALVGGGLGVKWQRYQLMKQSVQKKALLRPNYGNYVLDVKDLLRFWESKVEVYLHDRKSRVKSKIREASFTKAECMRVISELEDFNEEENRATIRELKDKILLMNEITEDAQKVNHVLQRLEDEFVVKIEQLKVLVRQKEKFERDQYRHEELQGKAKKLIGKSSQIAQEWEEDKEQIQIQITGMVQAFQSQLHHTKDFVKAEIQMVRDSDPKAWLELREPAD